MTTVEIIEQHDHGVVLFRMTSEVLTVVVSNLGCHVLSLFAPDRSGIRKDVVLGFAHVEDCHHDGSYMGAVVGRVANRIGGASFDLNGKRYQLKANDGPNHLHGGEIGFNQKIFDYDILGDGIQFTCTSADGEEGYPGNLRLRVVYRLVGDTFGISYRAVCDQDTLANFTNHMYFNLSGTLENIAAHQLQVSADRIACVDAQGVANGTFLRVDGTPFDFRTLRTIGTHLHDDHIQLQYAGGYDHSFLLARNSDQVVLFHEETGRKMTISTTLPVIQVYTGNFLAGGCNGKHGKPYQNRDGIALETQLLPNSIHIEKKPSVILPKNQVWEAETTYRFTTE
ncbi:MAG: aldose epimerase family protein [Eubacteriales bacterium]|nr:aldose epimerase family protein [Eubacteriales bacterium]